jgi:hypothetical protein
LKRKRGESREGKGRRVWIKDNKRKKEKEEKEIKEKKKEKEGKKSLKFTLFYICIT